MGVTQVSESYDTEDLEKGGDAQKSNIIHGLKRRSSVTLKAIVRTFSVAGGKNVVRIPSPQQPQSLTLHEEEEKASEGSATPTQERSDGCYSNAMSDVELTATEVIEGSASGSHVTPSSTEIKGHSPGSATC